MLIYVPAAADFRGYFFFIYKNRKKKLWRINLHCLAESEKISHGWYLIFVSPSVCFLYTLANFFKTKRIHFRGSTILWLFVFVCMTTLVGCPILWIYYLYVYTKVLVFTPPQSLERTLSMWFISHFVGIFKDHTVIVLHDGYRFCLRNYIDQLYKTK